MKIKRRIIVLLFILLAAVAAPSLSYGRTLSAKAENTLGDNYYAGKGVPRDNSKAIYWYKQAAEQGNTDAQEILYKLGY